MAVPKSHDYDGASVEVEGRGCVHHAVRSHVARVVVKYLHPGPCARANHKRGNVEIGVAQFLEDAGQGRHNAADGDAVDVLWAHSLDGKHVQQEQAVLVGKPVGVRGQTPSGQELLPLEDSQSHVRVADVYCQQHSPPPVELYKRRLCHFNQDKPSFPSTA